MYYILRILQNPPKKQNKNIFYIIKNLQANVNYFQVFARCFAKKCVFVYIGFANFEKHL